MPSPPSPPPHRRLGCGWRRASRDGWQRVGAGLGTLADPPMLMAADVREHLAATHKGRGASDNSRRAIERLRHDSLKPDLGRLGLEGLQPAPCAGFFGGLLRVGSRLARPLFGGDTLLLASLFRSLPRPELRRGLREDTAHGQRDDRGPQEETNPALPPERAAPFLVAQWIKIGERLGRLRARLVGVVHDEGARGEARVPQDAPHTGHEACVPRHLALSNHPGQGCQRLGPEAGALKARPAPGVGDQHGGDTTRQPGPWRGGQRVAWMRRTHGVINGFNQGAYAGRWLSNNPRRLQAIGGRTTRGCDGRFEPDETHRASSNGRTGAGRTVERSRMGLRRYRELNRSTQLPLNWANRQEQKT